MCKMAAFADQMKITYTYVCIPTCTYLHVYIHICIMCNFDLDFDI